MNYAFTTFSCPDLSLDETLALAKRTGYAGVDPVLGKGHAHGIEIETDAAQRSAIRERIIASGVAIRCLGTPERFADPATLEASLTGARRAIELAADIGSPLIHVFGGPIPQRVTRDDARERIIASLRALADHAAERGVTVCLETHDDWSAPEENVAIMRGVDHPAAGIVWDIMHPVRTGGATLEASFEMLQPWIRHVHIHDGSASPDKREFTPIGTGDFDHRRVLELLRDAGYGGFLSGEWIAGWMDGWKPSETYLPRELATMQGYERELEMERA